MGTRSIRPLVDRALDGQLDEILRRYINEALSPSGMSLRLASEYQVEVSGPTMKKWVSSLPPRPSSPAKTAQTGRTAQTAQTAQTDGVDSSWSQVEVAL